MARIKQVLWDIACDMVDRGLSPRETYDLVNNYYKLGVDFRTRKGKAFYMKLCYLADNYEHGGW